MKKTLLRNLFFFFILLMLMPMRHNAQTLLNNMPVPLGSVYALEKDGNTIYMGGFFSSVNSIPHKGLARFDASTGSLDSWTADIDNNGVTCIAIAGNKIIAGGSFTTVNSQTRYGICMFDRATGNLDSWSDTANYSSWRMGIGSYNNFFYYARKFSSCRIVCVDANTGNFTSWQTDSILSGDINAIYPSGSYVYVGGQFSVGVGLSVYSNLCRFDQATGHLDLSWHPEPAIHNFGVTAIVKTNSGIFVGGDFNTISGQARKGVAGYDAAGNLNSFNQNSSSYEVLSLCGDGNYVWVGGNSYMLGGQTRYRLAQINIYNSMATCWNVASTSTGWSTCQAILVKGDTVFSGPYGSPQLAVFSGSPLPLQGAIISGPATVQPLQAATYSVPSVAGNTYSWTITGGTGISSSNSINVTWGSGPTGVVSVTETNPSGSNCSADTSLQVSITNTTNISNEAKDIFSIFPNPCTDRITITSNSKKITSLRVFDLYGKLIMDIHPEGKECTAVLANISKGIYLVKVEIDEVVYTEKLLRE